MKKIVAISLSLLMVLGLCACGEKTENSNNSNTEVEQSGANNEEKVTSSESSNNSKAFKFYFSFQELNVKNFDSNKKIEKIHAFNGEDKILSELPLSYEELMKDRTPHYKYKSGFGDEYIQTNKTRNMLFPNDEMDRLSQIYWNYADGTTGFSTYFYDDCSDSIEDAISKKEWYVDIGGSIFHEPLRIPDGEYADFKDIVDYLGNPSKIYVNLFQDYESLQRCDYWLIYNYGDYSLAFNFDQDSNKTEEEWMNNPMPELRYPNLKDCYIYGGSSFEKFITKTSDVTSFSYENYVEYK